jgi:hypothetical protein
MTQLDDKLRVNHDQAMADAQYASDALNSLMTMAMQSDAYRKGYAYASVALVWARKEHARLVRILTDGEKP